MKKYCLTLLAFFAAFGLANANASTLTEHPVADTYLRGGNADQGYGAAPQILFGTHASVGPFHGLLRFDLSALPTTDVVLLSATLTLTSDANGVDQGADDTINVYLVSSNNADWFEGTENGTDAAGSSCWNGKARYVHGGGTSTNWAGSQGASSAGEDYEAELLASFTGRPSTLGTSTMLFTSQPALTAAVATVAGGFLNLWCGNDATAGVSDFFRIMAREKSATASTLVIDYIVPEPVTAGLLALVGLLLRHRS
ncbi:MAG: DNRLRE domain-containing protein [bacterium]|nr:DNRLRE domain-containing protein [bacterium]